MAKVVIEVPGGIDLGIYSVSSTRDDVQLYASRELDDWPDAHSDWTKLVPNCG